MAGWTAGDEAKQRFALALAAPLTAVYGDPFELGGRAPTTDRGRAALDDFLGDRGALEDAGITTTEQLVEHVRAPVGAHAIATAVLHVGLASHTGIAGGALVWELLAAIAHRAQAQFTSWEHYGEAFKGDLAAARAAWGTVPWATKLDAASAWAEMPLRLRFALAIAAPHTDEPYAFRVTVRDGFPTRGDLLEWIKPRLHGDAAALSHIAQAVRGAAELLSDDDAWNILLLTAKRAQLTYASWDAFGAACGGDVDRARSVWADLPWNLELDVTIVDPSTHVRVLAVSCAHCGAPRTRPSPTAYVYCDSCGALVDYDFAVAMGTPVAQPGPVYERLHAQLALDLSSTRERGDLDGYRALQRRLFGAWLDACPQAAPVRVKDPAYREKHVAWLAEAQVVADFDGEARDREAAMHRTIGQLQFIAAGAAIRVPGETFRALATAYLDYESRRDELFQERGVYALHPEGAPRDVQRRIGFSAFAQAWLPMLEAADAQWLVERTGLVREYRLLPPVSARAMPCTHCGGPLSIVDAAKRVVCDHCGRLVDIVGST